VIARRVDPYWSADHRDDPGHGGLVAVAGSDEPHQPWAVRRAFTEGFRAWVDVFLKPLPGRMTSQASRYINDHRHL
jgi:hypothetical protein